jgi:DNA polymerase
MTTPRIHVDFESRSLIDLLKLGADVYARHWSTTPTMLAIDCDELGVSGVRDFLADREYYEQLYPCVPHPTTLKYRPPIPGAISTAIDMGYVFVAHNARFEQALWYHICHLKWGWPMPQKWSCTAARSRYWGIRASLDGAASDLEVLHQKNPLGKDFINDFCKPRKYKGPKKDGIVQLLWKEPKDDPQGWQNGLKYCLDDVKAEKAIDAILPDLPEFEQAIWDLDFKLNTRGLPIDIECVERALQFSNYYTQVNHKIFDDITSLRPTQRDKVLEYINQREDIEALGDLRSKTLRRIVRSELPADLQSVIDIRLETSQASIKKLETMLKCTDDDGRARGLFLYGGAHTMRWSAKRIQPQNFKRPDPKLPQKYLFDFLQDHGCWDHPTMAGLLADELPKQPNWITEAGYRFIRPLSYLSAGMRGFIKPQEGKKFVVADLAQIEVRTNMWLSRCMWVLDAFRRGEDVYVKFAADCMYNDNYDDYFEFKANKREVKSTFKLKRQKAKSAELGCGYQMGGPAFVAYCDNIDLIIDEDEAKSIVRQYRQGHPELADYNVGMWARAEQAAVAAVENEGQVFQLANCAISYHVHRLDSERYWLICTLPSGRHIAYYRPKLHQGMAFGKPKTKLTFRTEWNGKSYRESTYGGKLVENFVQATARDICAVGALNAEAAGYSVIGLVHDETITEVDIDFGSADDLAAHLCRMPAWITDLPLEAEGSVMMRYGK